MTASDLAAQLREEIAATEKSIFFWEAQPDDASVFGFNLAAYRASLCAELEMQQAALGVLEAAGD